MSKLVEVSVPLEAVGVVRCDFDGSYHVEVNGQEVDSDEKTYWQVIRARGGTVPWSLETRSGGR